MLCAVGLGGSVAAAQREAYALADAVHWNGAAVPPRHRLSRHRARGGSAAADGVSHWDLPGAAPHRARRAAGRHRRLRARQQRRLPHLARPRRLVALGRAGHPAARRCVEQRRGMAAQRTEIEYLRAALAGRSRAGGHLDRGAATRACASRGASRCGGRVTRQTLARARIDYVCINLDSGRAVRMPQAFAHAYVPHIPSRPRAAAARATRPQVAGTARSEAEADESLGAADAQVDLAGERAALARERARASRSSRARRRSSGSSGTARPRAGRRTSRGSR